MAHKRKDTFTSPLQWWKHLRDWKRPQNRKERAAAKHHIISEVNDLCTGCNGSMDHCVCKELNEQSSTNHSNSN